MNFQQTIPTLEKHYGRPQPPLTRDPFGMIIWEHIALNEFEGDLSSVLKLPRPKAIKALRQFPSIGDPGAEKILLFAGAHSILPLESNGLRVLLRLGFGEEKKSYRASYRSVQTSLESQIGYRKDISR
jgi:endonuclease III-like uncharacterized protein